MKATTNQISTVLTLAAVAAASLILSSSANAGTIVVTPLTNNESDIVNLGTTVVSAANFGSQAGGNTTVDINVRISSNILYQAALWSSMTGRCRLPST